MKFKGTPGPTYILGPDDLFGELSIFTGYSIPCKATALEYPTKILKIPEEVLQKIISENERVRNFIAMMASERLRENELFRLATPSTLARLVNYMSQESYHADDVLFHDIDAHCPISLIVLGSVQIVFNLDLNKILNPTVMVNHLNQSSAHNNDKTAAGGLQTEKSSSESENVGAGIISPNQGDFSSTESQGFHLSLGCVEISQNLQINSVVGVQHLFTKRPIRARATALEPTTVLKISRKDFDVLLESDPSLKRSVDHLREKWMDHIKDWKNAQGLDENNIGRQNVASNSSLNCDSSLQLQDNNSSGRTPMAMGESELSSLNSDADRKTCEENPPIGVTDIDIQESPSPNASSSHVGGVSAGTLRARKGAALNQKVRKSDLDRMLPDFFNSSNSKRVTASSSSFAAGIGFQTVKGMGWKQAPAEASPVDSTKDNINVKYHTPLAAASSSHPNLSLSRTGQNQTHNSSQGAPPVTRRHGSKDKQPKVVHPLMAISSPMPILAQPRNLNLSRERASAAFAEAPNSTLESGLSPQSQAPTHNSETHGGTQQSANSNDETLSSHSSRSSGHSMKSISSLKLVPTSSKHGPNINDEAMLTEADLIANANDKLDQRGKMTGVIIWFGLLMDAVPESLVLGIQSNSASTSSLLALVVAVFLANLPEAMSSSATMSRHGMKKRSILMMWSGTFFLTFVGACLGALLFPPGSEKEMSSLKKIAAMEGICGGAMLTMIANTVLPEAFHQGGDVTGLACLFGFLAAMSVKGYSQS